MKAEREKTMNKKQKQKIAKIIVVVLVIAMIVPTVLWAMQGSV